MKALEEGFRISDVATFTACIAIEGLTPGKLYYWKVGVVGTKKIVLF